MMVDLRKDKIFRLCDKVGSGGTPDSSNPDYYDGAIRWVQTGDLNDGLLSQTEKSITKEGLESSSAKVFPAGTLLIAMYGATIGKMGILETSAATNQACCAMNFRSTMDTKYMFYKFLDIREPLISQGYGGGQQNISQEIIKQTYVFFPRLDEQRRIAVYLDKTCAAIDTAVEKKQKQLETLDALRKSIIHKAVTHGLDDSVELKASGVEYFEKIPRHWKFDRLKDMISLRNSKTDESSEIEDYLELEDIEQGTGKILSKRNTLEVESAVTIFKKGDVLFGKLRPYLEKYYLAEFDGKCTGEILAFEPIRIKGSFLLYCIASPWFMGQCNMLAYGAKMPRVNWPTQLAKINIPRPPDNEQDQIAVYLDVRCGEITNLKKNINNQISTLDQYRKSLIHECVTGKRRIADEGKKDE